MATYAAKLAELARRPPAGKPLTYRGGRGRARQPRRHALRLPRVRPGRKG
jgi:hypothetical protein